MKHCLDQRQKSMIKGFTEFKLTAFADEVGCEH